jgi:hypothetical protein
MKYFLEEKKFQIIFPEARKRHNEKKGHQMTQIFLSLKKLFISFFEQMAKLHL